MANTNKVSMQDEEAYNRLRSRLRADLSKIDDELIELPQLIQEAAEHCSDAALARDRAKQAYDIAQTEAADYMRTERKMSEAAIKAALPGDEDVQKHEDRFIEAKYLYSLWAGLVDSLKTKASTTKVTAELLVSGYIAPNAAYRENRREMTERRRARQTQE